MKFCYCDESGMGSEQVAVMAGIIVDSTRMHLTKIDWEELLNKLSNKVGRRVPELHACDFYSGNGPWRDITGSNRARMISDILTWIDERKHHIVLSAIDKTIFERKKNNGEIPDEIDTIWKALGFHTILSVQKAFQNYEGIKGNTVLILDHENKEEKNFKALIHNPPDWCHTYYNKRTNQDKLDMIVDVPYFGDSKQVPLIQVADFVAYFVRRYIELREERDTTRYTGEDKRLEEWAAMISARCIGSRFTYPSRGRCECSQIFYSISPHTIRDF